MNRRISYFAPVFLLSATFSLCASADDWSIDDLGTLPLGMSSASGINTVGWVVGAGGVPHALLYDGTMRDLGTLPGGVVSWATGINTAGWIVGTSGAPGGVTRAFLYDGTMHDLGTLPGGTGSYATGINDVGWIVGVTDASDQMAHAFLYDGTMHDLGTLPGGTGSWAAGINDAGWVVGYSGGHAFLYDGTMRDLGVFPGGVLSSAHGINAAGWVVGWGTQSDGHPHAFLYDGTMRDLGALPGTYCQATGINDGGWVVGGCQDDHSGDWRAVLYNESGIIDLSELTTVRFAGWQILDSASAVNETGQIVGTGIIAGQRHAFRLNPPSPPKGAMPGQISGE